MRPCICRSFGSNGFIYSRFLVPWLCRFDGWAIYADGDMLMRGDIAELWAERDRSKAVKCVWHDYKTKAARKYLGATNEDYPRKNWSSLILWNCGHPANQALTPELVMHRPGSYLHRFEWLANHEIGQLSKGWNWLVGEYDHNPYAQLYHYTLGTPCFKDYQKGPEAVEWIEVLRDMLTVEGERGLEWML